jgi:hypothetical protein
MNLTYKVGTLFSFSGFSFGTNEDFIATGMEVQTPDHT